MAPGLTPRQRAMRQDVRNAEPGIRSAQVNMEAQKLYNKGLLKNPGYDPNQIAYVAGGRREVNLNTGQVSGTSNPYRTGQTRYVSAQRLEKLRGKVGYDPSKLTGSLKGPAGKLMGGGVATSYVGPTGLVSYTRVSAASAATASKGTLSSGMSLVRGKRGRGTKPPTNAPDTGTSPGQAAGTNGAASTSPPSPYAEADTTTTGTLRAQGKSYAAGRTSAAASAMGQTGKTIRPGDQTPTPGQKKRAARLAVRGKRQKSGVKKGYHINKAGNVVPNKGRQNKPKPGK